jgi:hypothetical protein
MNLPLHFITNYNRIMILLLYPIHGLFDKRLMYRQIQKEYMFIIWLVILTSFYCCVTCLLGLGRMFWKYPVFLVCYVDYSHERIDFICYFIFDKKTFGYLKIIIILHTHTHTHTHYLLNHIVLLSFVCVYFMHNK